MRLHKIGRLGDAARLYRQVARLEPRNVEALRLLGSMHTRQGNFTEAERSYRKVVKIDARSADAHIELGVVLCQLGRPTDAVSSYQRAIELKPDYAGAHNNLGVALYDLGRFEEAIASYRRALEIEPGYAEAGYNLGNALMSAGRLDEAIASYQQAIALRPELADIHNALGIALRQAGRRDEAAASYLCATAVNPKHFEAYRNLGIVAFEANRSEDAASYYQRAAAINPDSAEAQGDLGNAMRALGRFDEALAHYNKALTMKPDYANAHHNLGVALKMLGRTDEARRALERAVQLAPRQVLFHAGLADLTRYAAGNRHLAAMEKLARDLATLGVEDQIQLHFSLAKAFADLAQHDRSFRHLLAGNALKRPQISYDEAGALGQFDRIRAIFTRAVMQERRGVGYYSSVPIFIIGMPRSGTTLVEQMLASHPKVFGAGELTDFQDAAVRVATRTGSVASFPEMILPMGSEELFAIGADYVAHVRDRAPSAERITNKMPGNFVAAGLVHLALPNARILHIRRNPVDTCFSNFSTLFAAEHPWAYDLGELGRYYRAYAALMEYWRELLPEEVMIEVQYESLVTDFETQSRRIVAHCGLEWNDACLGFYRTERPVLSASMVQVRQPVYQHSVGRWLPYKDMLGPLLAALETDRGA
jgi:tetratricopeptide (TPR) repeat protein